MKQRITGRVGKDYYEVLLPSGEVVKQIPLTEASPKLQAAIDRNGWEAL